MEKYKIIISTLSVYRGQEISIFELEKQTKVEINCLNIRNTFSVKKISDTRFQLYNIHATLILEKI